MWKRAVMNERKEEKNGKRGKGKRKRILLRLVRLHMKQKMKKALQEWIKFIRR